MSGFFATRRMWSGDFASGVEYLSPWNIRSQNHLPYDKEALLEVIVHDVRHYPLTKRSCNNSRPNRPALLKHLQCKDDGVSNELKTRRNKNPHFLLSRNLFLLVNGRRNALPRHSASPLPLQLLLVLLHPPNQIALHANLVPVLVKHERDRNDSNLQQTQQCSGPIWSQTSVHI